MEMKDPLEFVARDLWKRFGFVWDKRELAKSNSVDDSYRARCGGFEYCDSLLTQFDDNPDLFDEPAMLSYRNHNVMIVVKSASNVFSFAERENSGKRSLYCSVISSGYDASVEKIRIAGDLGKRLLEKNRVGNPDVVGYGSWELSLDNFAGLADFLYNLARNS